MAEYISYLRVSTQRQGIAGLGIDAQRAAVEQYVAQSRGTLLQEYVEVESGSCRARPVLEQSVKHCRRASAILLIARLDRLARNVAFVSSLMESGIEFVAADAPYANRLMIHILAAFAEHERTLISERTKAALAAAKGRGVALGLNGHRLAKANEAAAISFAETMRGPTLDVINHGAKTLNEIALQLNARGEHTRQGSRWTASGVHRLLHRLGLHRGPPAD